LDHANPAVIIGGLGGSGTRVAAALVQHWAIHLGSDLNEQLDNLTYTLIFKRREILDLAEGRISQDLQMLSDLVRECRKMSADEFRYLTELAREDRPQHQAEWLQARVMHLRAREASPDFGAIQHRAWGWKEPNSHVLLPHFRTAFPAARYIHVMRNGLDMAFSGNKNQLFYWGDSLLGNTGEASANRQLKYWCVVQKRAIEIGAEMADRFYLLNYDQLCAAPENEIAKLITFMQVDAPAALLASSCNLVDPPASLRFKSQDISQLDRDAIDYVASLGFAVR
jgi:hypothetical protein